MLDAASIVFGERGFAGATTDAIADAAGVSQAYVVRTFGSKESLFAEAATRAVNRITDTFRKAATSTGDPAATVQERLGRAYVELVADRGILLTVMHLFTLGHHPRFGPLAREGLLDVYRVLRDDAGLGTQDIGGFLARGMLINTVLGTRLPDLSLDPEVADLLSCVFDDTVAAEEVVALATTQPPLPLSERSSR